MKNFYLRLVFVSNGVFVFAASLIGPIFAIYLNELKVDVIEIGLTSTIFMASSTLCLAIISVYGDREKHRSRYLILGFMIRCVAWLSFIFVDSIFQIYIIQIILGIGEAVGSTSFDVIVAEHLDEGDHVKDYSIWRLIQSFAAALAALVGGIIAQEYGFDMLFIFMSILAFLSTVIFVYGLKHRRKPVI
jgi:DHA1 family quinolone resistance protein-like MFS transporter